MVNVTTEHNNDLHIGLKFYATFPKALIESEFLV